MENENNEADNKEDTQKMLFAISNALFQTFAILAYQYYALNWPMYVVMCAIGIIAFTQTLSFAGIVSGIAEYTPKDNNANQSGIRILIGIFYLISSYQIYQMGYVIFAGFAIAHASTFTVTHFMKWIKK